ncbi:MAG: hypothetical protein MUO89_07635 [Dehalococcoidia bacterium]|nr:hypothetical protein [Dehalococcoidia bacterium]
MEQMMGGMSSEEKEKMMSKMMEGFLEGMTSEEKQKMMEKMMSKMMGGMNVSEMMPLMMSKMMGGIMGGKKEGKENPCMPDMETKEDFRPWEFCPCRKLCEKGFNKVSIKEKA